MARLDLLYAHIEDPAVPLGRPSFELAGVGHVFEPATIWLRGTLGWELHF